MTRSYRFTFSDESTARFHEPRGWEVSLCYDLDRAAHDDLTAKRSAIAAISADLKRLGVKRRPLEDGGAYYVEGDEESPFVSEATFKLGEYARALEDLGRVAFALDLAKAAVHIRRLDAESVEWPTLTRGSGVADVEDRLDVLYEYPHPDLERLVADYRKLSREGLSSLTDRERDDLKKS